MLAIRFQRVGKKHQASFRIVVGEKRHKLQGKQTEYLGWYNPNQKKYEVNKERVLYWLKNGAKPSDTVHNFLVSAKIIEGKKIAVHKKSKAKKEPSAVTPQATPIAS